MRKLRARVMGEYFTRPVPRVREIVPVLAFASLILYGWTVIAFLRSLTVNWGLFLRADELVGIAAYLLLANFLEAGIILIAVLVLAALLPRRLLREMFVVRGTLLVGCYLGSIVIYFQVSEIRQLSANIGPWLCWSTAAAAVALLASARSARFRRAVESFADRCIIFLYIFLPLTFGALVVAVIRNLPDA